VDLALGPRGLPRLGFNAASPLWFKVSRQA